MRWHATATRFKWAPGPSPGFLVRWVNPGDWLAVIVKAADSKAWVYKRVNDGILQSPLSSGSTVSLTNGNWYTGKVVVGDDLGNSALQRLRFWIDTDDDGTWSDETALLDTTTVDDDWSAGYTGLFHGHIASTAAQDFDDVKIGYDNNADLDIDDGGDSIVINDDFASNATTLSYDDNGSLTDDGIFKFVYDAWNRLVAVKSRYTASTTQTTFATYAYDGANRRNSKVVANSGVEVYPNDGGETTVNFYYDDQWRIVETRNGSNQATWQHLWGTQYIDELIWLERNGDPTIGNDTDPDGTAGEGAESPADHRYFGHQDRNWSVVALTAYGLGISGEIIERATYLPYGSWIVRTGGSFGSEMSVASLTSTVGSAVCHQGLIHSSESSTIQARWRNLAHLASRWSERDPWDFVDGLNLYAAYCTSPLANVDPTGKACPCIAELMSTLVDFAPIYSHAYIRLHWEGPSCPDDVWIHYDGAWQDDNQNIKPGHPDNKLDRGPIAPKIGKNWRDQKDEFMIHRELGSCECVGDLGRYGYQEHYDGLGHNSNAAISQLLADCNEDTTVPTPGRFPGWQNFPLTRDYSVGIIDTGPRGDPPTPERRRPRP